MAQERVSRGEVLHLLLDVVDAAASDPSLKVGGPQAYAAALLIEDPAVLQRVVAALATILAFDLVSGPRPGPGAVARHRARLMPWLRGQRLEATWQVEP